MSKKSSESINNSKAAQCELFSGNSESDLDQIRELERKIFDWEVSEEDLDALIEKVKDSLNHTFVLRNDSKDIVGYLIAVPTEKVYEDLIEEDPDFSPSDSKVYIETFAIDKDYRGSLSTIRELFESVAVTSRGSGFQVISAHIPTEHLPLYERYADVEVLRTIKNWFDSGEDHHYIEISL